VDGILRLPNRQAGANACPPLAGPQSDKNKILGITKRRRFSKENRRRFLQLPIHHFPLA